MARVFIDGFEAGDLKLWDGLIGIPTIQTGISGMDGTYCVKCLTFTGLTKNLTAKDEYYVAFKLRISDLSNDRDFLCFYNGSTLLGFLNYYNYTLRAYKAATDTLLGTSVTPINANTTYLIELRYKPHLTTGYFQVKVNGVLDIDFSGSTHSSTVQINKVNIHNVNYLEAYYDNFVFDDAAWPGDTRIQAIVPTGAGTATQWAPSAGSNWQCVDEKPASESDFVSSNTIGHLDTYAAGDLTGSIENVKCVQVQALAVKEGAPTPLNMELALKSGVTTYLSGDNEVPATTSKGLYNLWEADPATSAAWEIAAVNAVEIGMKAVA